MAKMVSGRAEEITIELLDNAKSSLIHGIQHYLAFRKTEATEDIKFAIIHVFHAVELFLKARLAQAHPMLVFTKPECAEDDDPHTVQFEVLVRRLKCAEVSLSGADFSALDGLRKVRNQIEHHRIKKPVEEVQAYLCNAARFFESFLEREFSICLKDELSDEAYRALSEAIHTHEERLAQARAEIDKCLPGDKDRLLYTFSYCPECGEETIVTPDPVTEDHRVHCFFCGEEFYHDECPGCGGPILSSVPITEDNHPLLCEDCWEYRLSKD